MSHDDGPDLDTCPACGGPADNGNDRCVPPAPYECRACDAERQVRALEECLSKACDDASDAEDKYQRAVASWQALREWLRDQSAGWMALFDSDPRDRWRHRAIACDEALAFMAELEAGEVRP